MKRVVLALVLVAASARAQEAAPVEQLRQVEEEHSRLAHWLRQLEQQEGDVLAVLEAVEKQTLEAQAQAAVAEAAAREVHARLGEALAREASLLSQREAKAKELGPRLVVRYRLSGATYLKAMLSDGSIGDFLWRRRMVDRVLAGDLALVQSLAKLAEEAEHSRALIERERQALEQARSDAALRAEEAVRVRAEQEAVLAELMSKQDTYERMVSQLEEARGDLLGEIANLPPTPPGLGGFGARRGALAWPVDGEIELGFGLQTDARFGTKVQHKGLDLRATQGEEVLAPHPASVGFAGWFRGYGNLVVLDHAEGYYTLYAHLDALQVERGDRVEQGTVLGTVGSTASLKGAFLYFEVRSGAKALDPTSWLAPR